MELYQAVKETVVYILGLVIPGLKRKGELRCDRCGKKIKTAYCICQSCSDYYHGLNAIEKAKFDNKVIMNIRKKNFNPLNQCAYCRTRYTRFIQELGKICSKCRREALKKQAIKEGIKVEF